MGIGELGNVIEYVIKFYLVIDINVKLFVVEEEMININTIKAIFVIKYVIKY